MSVGVEGESGRGGVTGAVAAVTAGLDDLDAAPVWGLTDAELHEAIVDVTTQEARLAAQKARLLRESVSREAPDTRGRRGAVTKAVLTDRCRVRPGRAQADLANAAVTCPQTGDLRGLGGAWA